MENLLYLAPVLGCVLMMAVMMLMMRGHKYHGAHDRQAMPDHDTETAALRAEVEEIKRRREAR
jgi:hypothetical protein